jgi:RecA/RadA recombinase
MYEKIKELVGTDTLEIFGDSGSGKTTFVLEIAKAFSKEGKKVLYIDTEKNLLDSQIPKGIDYVYHSSFDDVVNTIQNIKPGYELVILDSMGLPILGKFAWLNARERGDILLKCEGISSTMKIYCEKNKAVALVTNQPESKFGKDIYHILRPFGDKSIFFYKEVWQTKARKLEPNNTEITIETFRSRKFGRKTELLKMVINNKGTDIKWSV